MSLLDKYMEGWWFRTNKPSFEAGQELSVFVTGLDGSNTPVARIGDSVLRLPDADATVVDKRVRLRVTDFDESNHTGTAEYLETIGESAF